MSGGGGAHAHAHARTRAVLLALLVALLRPCCMTSAGQVSWSDELVIEAGGDPNIVKPTLPQLGDVNNDGIVSALDLTIVRESIVAATLSGSLDTDRCDYLGNAGCGIDDAFIIDRVHSGAYSAHENACVEYGSP